MFEGKVLVLDGRSLASLAIVRSLGSKGLEVHCGESFKTNLTSYSKYVKKRVIYPSPKDEPEDFIHEILKIIQNENYDLVLPVRDDTTLLLSKYKKEINEHTKVYLADYEKIKTFNDKGETIKIAREAGVPVPKTYFSEEIDKESIKKEIPYPALIRPRIGSGSRGIEMVNNIDEFDEKYKHVSKNFQGLMIQEYVDKIGYSTACILLDEYQKTVASFTYERVKEYPLSGGPTVVGISDHNKNAKKHAIKLLKQVGWKGPAEVEFIINKDKELMLLEVNPRFWMPLHLAIRSGVDFPYLVYQLSKCEKIKQKSDYNAGIRYRWLLPNEFLCLVSDKNDHEEFKNFFRFFDENTCYGSISKNDPMPAIGTIVQSLDFLFDKEKRKMIFDRGW